MTGSELSFGVRLDDLDRLMKSCHQAALLFGDFIGHAGTRARLVCPGGILYLEPMAKLSMEI